MDAEDLEIMDYFIHRGKMRGKNEYAVCFNYCQKRLIGMEQPTMLKHFYRLLEKGIIAKKIEKSGVSGKNRAVYELTEHGRRSARELRRELNRPPKSEADKRSERGRKEFLKPSPRRRPSYPRIGTRHNP